MTESGEPHTTSVGELERALRQRGLAPQDLDPCAELVCLATALTDHATDAVVRDAANHMASCQLCAETMLSWQRLQARTSKTSSLRFLWARLKARLPRVRLAHVVPLAAAASLAVLFLVLRPGPGGDGRAPAEAPEFALKGQTVQIHLAIRRGDRLLRAPSGTVALPGDELHLFYSAKQAGYLAVLALDEERQIAVLLPASGGKSAWIQAGEEVPLADGAVVEKGGGCQFVVSVFSDQAMDTAVLAKTIAQKAVVGPHCSLTIPSNLGRRVIIQHLWVKPGKP